MDWKLALNFHSENLVIFNPADIDIDDIKKTLQNGEYHIYLIAKRKKLFFEDSIRRGDFHVTSFYQLDERHNKIFYHVNHSLDLSIDSTNLGIYNIVYKGNKVAICDFVVINDIFNIVGDSVGTSDINPIPSDLEVMYVGQSFGRSQSRTIDSRITNHEKLQKISLQILKEGSNEEVLVIGIKVSTNDMGMALVHIGSGAGEFSLKDMYDLKEKASMRLTKGQELTVFEAALINYFQPQYNKEYKMTFPSPDFSSYSELYETEFDYASMTVDGKPILARLFSAVVQERKYVHYRKYSLSSNSEKDSFYEFLK